MQKVLLGLVLLTFCNVSFACYRPPVKIEELNSQPIVRVLSENTKYLLEMHPAKWIESNTGKWMSRGKKLAVVKDSLGIVYSVADDGEMKSVWQVEGIYPREFRTGMFPFLPERTTYFISNDGSKVVSVLERFFRGEKKPQFLIYEQSGNKLEIPFYSPRLIMTIRCELRQLRTYNLRPDDVLEFTNLKAVGSQTHKESWEMSIHTGKIIKKP